MVEISFNGKELYAPIMKNTRRKLDDIPKIVPKFLCKADEKSPSVFPYETEGQILAKK